MDSSSAADLDKLIQSLEYENQQYVKLIEKENQHIEALGVEIQVKKEQGEQLQREITQLDEDTKRSHKQFVYNRDNGESLKRTLDVLKDHESALGKSLKCLVDKGNETRKERSMMLEHYREIWRNYEEQYNSFPLAQDLKAKQETVSNLQMEVQRAEQKIQNLHAEMYNYNNNQNIDFRDMVKFIVKLAELKRDTNKIVSSVKSAKEKKKRIEEEFKKAEEKRKIEELEAEQEKSKLSNSMEQDERNTSDGGEASTLISMIKDDCSDDTIKTITSQPMRNLTNNMAALNTKSHSQTTEQMATGRISPSQIQIDIDADTNQNSLNYMPANQMTAQTIFRPTIPSLTSQRLTSNNIPQISCQNFAKPPPPQPQQIQKHLVRNPKPQIQDSPTPNMLRYVPRVSVPQIMNPSIQQFGQTRTPVSQMNPPNQQFAQSRMPTGQQIRTTKPIQPASRSVPQQFVIPTVPQPSQYGVRPSTPQIRRPSAVHQVGPRTAATQPPSLSQPYQLMEGNRTSPNQHQARLSTNRMPRPATPSIPKLPVTDPVKKMQASIGKPQTSEQSPKKPTPKAGNSNDSTQQLNKRSPVHQLTDENGNIVTASNSSPSLNRPKTPESGKMNIGNSDYSPFDLEKHRKHLQELKKSPGQPLKECRPMFSADKVDPSKSQDSGIFTGFQTMGRFDNGKAKPNNQGDSGYGGFSTEMSMFQSSEIGQCEGQSFFGEKTTSLFSSPDIGGGDTGFSFGGSSNDKADSSGFSFGGSTNDKAESTGFSFGGDNSNSGSSIMSLFGDSSTEEQQETSFSFSFGGTSTTESPARGFSLF